MSRFALVALVCLGCSPGEEAVSSADEAAVAEWLAASEADGRALYLRCGSTSWRFNERSRLEPVADMPWVRTLTFDVEKDEFIGERSGDVCTLAVVEPRHRSHTSRFFFLPRWNRTYLRPVGTHQIEVPEQGLASEELRHAPFFRWFHIRYPAEGTYRATVDLNEKILTLEGEGPDAPPSWKIQALMFMEIDFAYEDDTGAHHVRTEMDPASAAKVEAIIAEVIEQDFPALSSGLQTPTYVITRIQEPLTQLTQNGPTCYFVGTHDVVPFADPTADSILAFFESHGIDEATGLEVDLMPCALGLTSHTGTTQTLATMKLNGVFELPHYYHNAIKHEWGHSILFYHDAIGGSPLPMVDNHRPQDYVNCRTGLPYSDDQDPSVPGGHYHAHSGFTHDYYSGEIALATEPDRCIGIGPDAWWLGGPFNKRLFPLPLFNGSFEILEGMPPMPEGWRTEQWGNPEYALDDQVVQEGTYSARIRSPDPTTDPYNGLVDGALVQTIEVEPYTVYRVSGWIRTEGVECDRPGGGATVSARLDFWPIQSRPLAGTTDEFVPVFLDFNSREHTSVDIQARLGVTGNACVGSAWFDDLRWSTAGPAEAQKDGPSP